MTAPDRRPIFYDKLSRNGKMWVDGALAQIEVLTERLAIAEEKAVPGGKTEVHASLGGYSLRDMLPLPPRTEIEFASGEGRDERLMFRMPTTRDQGWVEVVAERSILIRPGASNVVFLRPQSWHPHSSH
jgi:hypothetical protein